MSKLIELHKLWKGKNNYEYSNKVAEPIVLGYVANYLGKNVESITDGFYPAHDGVIGGLFYEVKVQSSYLMSIEISRFNGTASGINSTNASYWIMINQGNSILRGEKVKAGKIRVMHIFTLKTLVDEKLSRGEVKRYEPNEHNALGSIVVELDPIKDFKDRGIDDGWIGDVELVQLNEGIGYNFDVILRKKWK